MKIDILGLKITVGTKHELLSEIADRASKGIKTIVVTPYSEFFYYGAKDYRFRNIVNNADYSLPDGISVQWLAEFFSRPLTAENYYAKILQALFQEISSGIAVFFNPTVRNKVIPERISGADFFWDIVSTATERNQKVFFLGGFSDTAERAAEKVLQKFPTLHVAWSNANPGEGRGVEAIAAFQPDYLLVAYGPIKQEYWISEHLHGLQATVAIGIGGTLDYVSGVKSRAPKFLRILGLEWLYRLMTQPYRIKRIWHATICLGLGALRDKVFRTLSYRQNAAGVVMNKDKQVLIVSRCREHNAHGKESHWQFPQGGLERGETPQQAVLREMHEELGSDKFTVIGQCSKTYSYDWQHFFRPLLRKTWRSQGQNQHIFYLLYTGQDDQLSLDETEADTYKWVAPGELRAFIHPMRQAMLTVALSELPDNLAKI